MKVLIDPNTFVQHIVGWKWDGKNFIPTFEVYKNSARVCEVQEVDFPVAEPLFWVESLVEVIPDQFYFNLETQMIIAVENEPVPLNPPAEIPVTEI